MINVTSKEIGKLFMSYIFFVNHCFMCDIRKAGLFDEGKKL
ncbi:hypothetical protein [Campylobacter fetus]|nr:hypothetical protein [Campylobacter fetus]